MRSRPRRGTPPARERRATSCRALARRQRPDPAPGGRVGGRWEISTKSGPDTPFLGGSGPFARVLRKKRDKSARLCHSRTRTAQVLPAKLCRAKPTLRRGGILI